LPDIRYNHSPSQKSSIGTINKSEKVIIEALNIICQKAWFSKVKKQTRYYYCFFLLSTETSRWFLFLFFFLFPSILQYQTNICWSFEKISKISQIFSFFLKTFFFQKNKIQLSGKKYNFSFLSVPTRPTKEKEKNSLNLANLSHS